MFKWTNIWNKGQIVIKFFTLTLHLENSDLIQLIRKEIRVQYRGLFYTDPYSNCVHVQTYSNRDLEFGYNYPHSASLLLSPPVREVHYFCRGRSTTSSTVIFA